MVFFTHVEMFLTNMSRSCLTDRFLHARGDVSCFCRDVIAFDAFSPRTWRCFFLILNIVPGEAVFSTHVEMFPSRLMVLDRRTSFLHARGELHT